MTHDLPNRIQVQAGALHMLRPFRIDIGAEAAEDNLVECRKVVARDRLARRDGDVPPGDDGEDAAAHRAVVPDVSFFAAPMFTQQFDNVMLAPDVHALGTPNRDG